MSQETLEWLNEHTLIGYTEKYGHAWHDLGDSNNHYPGAVPVDDVLDRLFNWECLEANLAVRLPGGKQVTDPKRKVLYHSETHEVLGVHGRQRKTHQYQDWLVHKVADMLDSELSIGSAGLLRDCAVAWVQVELDDTITTPEGVAFRPHLLCKTSHDGTLSTSYGRSVTNTVCDNTLQIASTEHGGQIFRIRHTSNSDLKVLEAREAVGIVFKMADQFMKEVSDLCATTVTDAQFDEFLEALMPTGESKQAKTITGERHATLRVLWNGDDRVAPWKNTAWGALQAVNTAQQHVFDVRGDREGVNVTKKVYGQSAKDDAKTLQVLEAVLA